MGIGWTRCFVTTVVIVGAGAATRGEEDRVERSTWSGVAILDSEAARAEAVAPIVRNDSIGQAAKCPSWDA